MEQRLSHSDQQMSRCVSTVKHVIARSAPAGMAEAACVTYVLASSAETPEGVARHALCSGATRGPTLCGIDEPAGHWQLHGFARDGRRIQCERCRAAAMPPQH
jgi:hypothetical protein